MKYGYARVSTDEQSLDAQLQVLSSCDKIYSEKLGALKDRPELEKLLNTVNKGDSVTVVKLDRLGRSLRHLIEIGDLLRLKGVDLISISDNINTTTPQGRLIFNMFASFAEFERELISERTKAGLKAVRSKGVVLGRPVGLSQQAQNNKELAMLWKSQKKPVKEICSKLNISKSTYYQWVTQ
jgi:DNA invertase Pin-like site-specific DNA recombinase